MKMNVPLLLKQMSKELPKFPDGRVDYTNSSTAPIISVFVEYDKKILILKRSNKVLKYKNKWSSVGGYIDEDKPLKEKALEEVQEELGVKRRQVKEVVLGKEYELVDEGNNTKWLVFPILVKLKEKPVIRLDWENTGYKWIKPSEINLFDTVPALEKSLKLLLKKDQSL